MGLAQSAPKYLRPDATVVAFEPAPHTASRLIANAELNGSDLRIVTCALGETSGLAALSVVTRGSSGLTVGALLSDAGFALQSLPPAHPDEKSVATNFLATRPGAGR